MTNNDASAHSKKNIMEKGRVEHKRHFLFSLARAFYENRIISKLQHLPACLGTLTGTTGSLGGSKRQQKHKFSIFSTCINTHISWIAMRTGISPPLHGHSAQPLVVLTA